MKLNALTELQVSRGVVDAFGGYDHNLRIPENEFYDMENMTSQFYPVLSPRVKRGVYPYPAVGTHKPNGLIAKDALCYVDGTKLYVNNAEVTGLTLTDSKKQLISMGAYILIFPDKKYVNTKKLTDYGSMEASFSTTTTVYYELCKADGEVYGVTTVQATEPSNPNNMDLWIDTSSTPHVLKQYSASSAIWMQIATTYVKIKSTNIAAGFAQYDGVKIDGIDGAITSLQDLNGQTSVRYEAYHDSVTPANDYIVVVGMLDQATSQNTALTVSRSLPNMDFVIESGNRLWGCRYGLALDGSVVNEIYASKLGDFKNWNCFMGLSTDSYAASCGTDGQWTGAITHLGYPLFFKENVLHKVYGNFPSNFQIKDTACRGVMKGAGESLAIVNEVLYYKSRNGVCAYDGSLPQEISAPLGEIRYTGLDTSLGYDPLRCGAVAGAHDNKYYISMKSEVDNGWNLFVYDASKGMWHREDGTRVDAFCSCRDELYYIDHNDTLIHTVLGSGTKEASDVRWFAETGVIGTDSPDRKYVSRVVVRLSLTIGASVKIYIQYDGFPEWKEVMNMTGRSLRSFAYSIKPMRCDHFRLRIEGIGEAKIYSIAKTIETGSDDNGY